MSGFNDILKQLAARSSNNTELEAGDYIKDDLIYCGKCNTPRQVVIELGDGEKIKPTCLCKCRTEARDKADAEAKARERALWVERTRRRNIAEDKLLNFTFENDKQPDSKYSALFKRYCNKWEKIKADNIGLILWGETGRGKSYYAGCICNELIRQGIPAYATAEPRILNDLFNASDKSAFIQKLVKFPLLLIDDFGTARNTEYAQEQIFTVIDERYKANLPLIITTNLTPAQFNNPQSITEQRIFDRLKAMGQFIEVRGKNWRQDEAAQKSNAFINLMSGGDDN